MTNMMNGAVAIYGGYGAMEIRQPLTQAVESVAQAVEDLAVNAHISLRELKNTVAAVIEKKLPKYAQLMEMHPVIAARTVVGGATLTAYENGYAVYEEDGAHTVMAINRCGDYRYDFNDGTYEVVPAAVFEDAEWSVRLVMEGERRMESNRSKTVAINEAASLDCDGSDWSDAVMVDFLDHYRVNERINDRGVRIDTKLVRQAITCDLLLSDAMTTKAYELTGLENPNSVSQLKTWLDERGISMDTLGKKNVTEMIGELDKNGVDAEAMDMLKLRLQMAKSSVKKYQAAERCVCPDGRARGLFQLYGASRTGRYSGRNIQLQNLPQNHISTLDEARTLVKMGCFDMVESIYGNTPDVLSQLIRTMLIPKDGCEFIVADFSAIEARVLAWEAGEQWVLDAFKNGEDLYCATASQMFHVPVVKHGINGDLRQKGKIATLACGYGGSSGALISMGALQMGLKEEELPEIIDSWREANPKIVQYWWDVEKAAMQAFKTGERQDIGRISFAFSSGTLWMVLPSGRKLAYLVPKQQPNRFGRMSLTYEGVGQNHKWARQETYSGRLVENATQAIARDILAEAMARIEDEGLNIVAHVHDEVIIEAPKDKYTVDEICRLMAANPDWCDGLPLAAAGYKGDYYFKD